jgi:lysophospholipase L1-like esterase
LILNFDKFSLAVVLIGLPFFLSAYSSNNQPADVPQERVTAYPWDSPKDWWTLHEKNLVRAQGEEIRVLFLGDSIIRAWGGAGGSVWTREYLSRGAANFSIGGDTTQNLLWRITEGNELEGLAPKIVVLMIGTNNFSFFHHTPNEVVAGVTKNVTSIIERLPDSKIILLGILPRGPEPDTKIRNQVAEANRMLAELDDSSTVFFLDMGNNFLENDGSISKAVMPDYLHLTARGYEIWAESMAPLFEQLMH